MVENQLCSYIKKNQKSPIMLIHLLLLITNLCTLYTSIYPAFKIVPSKHRHRMLDDLSYVTGILDTYNIRYTLACGTLLGMARSNQLILWDDDIDIYVLAKDLDLIKTVCSNLIVNDTCFGLQVIRSDRIGIDIFELHRETRDGCDILSYRPNSGNRQVEKWRRVEYLTPLEWESITHVLIDGRTYSAITDPHRYLSSAYSIHYATDAIIYKQHNDQRSIITQVIGILLRIVMTIATTTVDWVLNFVYPRQQE